MVENYVSAAELRAALLNHDRELRDHYDELIEKSISSLMKTLKWVIGLTVPTVATILGLMLAWGISAKEAQTSLDAVQTRQIMDAWKAIENTAAILNESNRNTEKNIDRVDDKVNEVRQEARERIRQLEEEQRTHERQGNHQR